MKAVASQSDVSALEARGLPPDLPSSTYEMILRGAALNPSAPALSFFLSTADHREPERWTYGVGGGLQFDSSIAPSVSPDRTR